MKTFPMIRTKWSNEHIMAALLGVLAFYHLPGWVENPAGILRFLVLVGTGLIIDLVASLIRYKRVWCCVSGGVTAAMISLLTMGVPFWGQMIAVTVALILGKHLWGGTGRNLVNPPMLGLLTAMLFFDVSYPFFPPSLFLLPAMLLSIPFLRIRPFAGVAYLIGMSAGLYLNHDMSIMAVLASGALFWGCLVMTDPVTVTFHPVAGAAIGFLAGFGALLFDPMPVAYVIGIFAVNLFSSVIDRIPEKVTKRYASKLRIPKVVITGNNHSLPLLDLTKDENYFHINADNFANLSGKQIIDRMKRNDVFGMGGAAFPAHRKLEGVINSSSEKKYLIINGVECDPGLMHDDWLLHNRREDIRKGVELLQVCVSFDSIHLAVKKKEGLDFPKPITLHQVPDYYPIGAERLLIQEVLGIKMPGVEVPSDYGILILNVQTVLSVYQAVVRNRPINSRYLTVADLNQKTARIAKVPLRMKITDVMEAAYPGVMSVFAGGGIMQSYLTDEEDTVGKTVNFIATGMIPKFKESPQCSHCGECIKYCPAGLKVNRIVDLADQGKVHETEKYHVTECIQCGCCSYSCLAGRNLAASVKVAKEAVKIG